MFGETIIPVLEKLFYQGKNALVFTYGVTNAGKSYTIVGDLNNPGILPNTMSWLLKFKNDLMQQN